MRFASRVSGCVLLVCLPGARQRATARAQKTRQPPAPPAAEAAHEPRHEVHPNSSGAQAEHPLRRFALHVHVKGPFARDLTPGGVDEIAGDPFALDGGWLINLTNSVDTMSGQTAPGERSDIHPGFNLAKKW